MKLGTHKRYAKAPRIEKRSGLDNLTLEIHLSSRAYRDAIAKSLDYQPLHSVLHHHPLIVGGHVGHATAFAHSIAERMAAQTGLEYFLSNPCGPKVGDSVTFDTPSDLPILRGRSYEEVLTSMGIDWGTGHSRTCGFFK